MSLPLATPRRVGSDHVMRRLLITMSITVIAAPAEAADIQAGPGDYLAAVDALGPGDTLHLTAGQYTGCLRLVGKHGAPGMPITIQGPDAGPPAVLLGSNCRMPSNPREGVMIFLSDASYITVRDLELDAEGTEVSGVRGGFGTTPVHHITLERLYIHDNDVNNQPSGISSFATAWDWVIRFNVIERTGLGMYLGDSDGTDPFIGGTIEHNLILNPKGYAMQIKHQLPREAVPGMPGDGRVTVLRHNVLIKADNAALGGDARPNLLIGDVPPSGVGMNDRYEIYGNFLFQNQTDVEPLFQGEGNLAFHDNVLVNAFGGTGILVQPHNGLPRTIDIYRTTILTEGVGVTITGGAPGTTQSVRGNAVYANGMPAVSGGVQSDNVVGTLVDAAAALVDATPTLGQLDPFPADEALRGAPLDWSAYASHLDVGLDFNGAPRDGTWRGAYAGAGANPGWALAATIKPPAGAPPPVDGGVADAGAVGDAGAEADAGAPADAGVPADAGGALDAGGAGPDAAAGLDAAGGADASEPAQMGVGGGCAAAGPGDAGALWGLALIGAVLRRRRR